MARFRVHRGLPPSAFVELAHRPVQLRLRGHGGRWPLASSARRGLIGAATWDMAINSLFISTQASELKFMHARKWSSDSNGLPCWNRLRYAAAAARSAAADPLPSCSRRRLTGTACPSLAAIRRRAAGRSSRTGWAAARTAWTRTPACCARRTRPRRRSRRDPEGKEDIFLTWSHMSEPSNGQNLTECRRNGVREKKSSSEGMQVTTNF